MITARDFCKFTIDKIEAIYNLSNVIAETSTGMAKKLNMKNQQLGGILGSVRRTKINGMHLTVPICRDSKEGVIWQLNEEIASKEDFRKITKEILIKVGRLKGGEKK